MIFVFLILFLSVLLGWVKHRRGVKNMRAGLDPNRPQQIVMQTDDPTGPRRAPRRQDGNL